MWRLFVTIMLVLILLNTCSINQAIHRISPMPGFGVAYAFEACEKPLIWEVIHTGVIKKALINYKEEQVELAFDIDETTTATFCIPFELLIQEPMEIIGLVGHAVAIEVGLVENSDGDIVVRKVRVNPFILE